MVEPVNPFQHRVLHGIEGPPRPACVDHLRLVEANDGLGEGIVVRVADAAGRGLDTSLGKPLGVANRQVMTAAIAEMHPLKEWSLRESQGGSVASLPHGKLSRCLVRTQRCARLRLK